MGLDPKTKKAEDDFMAARKALPAKGPDAVKNEYANLLNPHFSHNYAFVVFDGSDLRADRVGGLGDACGPTKGQAEAVPWFDDVCGGQPSVYALSGSCSGRGVAEANVSEAEFDLVGKG